MARLRQLGRAEPGVRPILLVSLSALLLACTERTVVQRAGDPGPDGGVGSSGERAVCEPSDTALVVSAEVVGVPSIALAGSRLALGYVDPRGVPTVRLHDLAPGAGASEPTSATWDTAKVRWESMGAWSVMTSLAHNGDRLGFGWSTERSFPGASKGVRSTRFATVSVTGEDASPAVRGNDDAGRSGSDDKVEAFAPKVSPFADRFLLLWNDTRTKEPVVQNVNLALWSGVYGRTYDAHGQGASRDVQIAQPSGCYAKAGAAGATGGMALWMAPIGYHRQVNLHARHAEGGDDFTPAEPPPPVATFDPGGSSPSIAAATGPGGRVLVVVAQEDVNAEQGAPWSLFGTVLLTAKGSVVTGYAEWSERTLETPAVVATDDGWVVAAYERDDGAVTGLRVFWLDASGQRTHEARSNLSLGEDQVARAMSISASGRTVRVGFVAEPAARGGDVAEIEAHSATFCAPE
jgi:hypothetical protein